MSDPISQLHHTGGPMDVDSPAPSNTAALPAADPLPSSNHSTALPNFTTTPAAGANNGGLTQTSEMKQDSNTNDEIPISSIMAPPGLPPRSSPTPHQNTPAAAPSGRARGEGEEEKGTTTQHQPAARTRLEQIVRKATGTDAQNSTADIAHPPHDPRLPNSAGPLVYPSDLSEQTVRRYIEQEKAKVRATLPDSELMGITSTPLFEYNLRAQCIRQHLQRQRAHQPLAGSRSGAAAANTDARPQLPTQTPTSAARPRPSSPTLLRQSLAFRQITQQLQGGAAGRPHSPASPQSPTSPSPDAAAANPGVIRYQTPAARRLTNAHAVRAPRPAASQTLVDTLRQQYQAQRAQRRQQLADEEAAEEATLQHQLRVASEAAQAAEMERSGLHRGRARTHFASAMKELHENDPRRVGYMHTHALGSTHEPPTQTDDYDDSPGLDLGSQDSASPPDQPQQVTGRSARHYDNPAPAPATAASRVRLSAATAVPITHVAPPPHPPQDPAVLALFEAEDYGDFTGDPDHDDELVRQMNKEDVDFTTPWPGDVRREYKETRRQRHQAQPSEHKSAQQHTPSAQNTEEKYAEPSSRITPPASAQLAAPDASARTERKQQQLTADSPSPEPRHKAKKKRTTPPPDDHPPTRHIKRRRDSDDEEEEEDEPPAVRQKGSGGRLPKFGHNSVMQQQRLAVTPATAPTKTKRKRQREQVTITTTKRRGTAEAPSDPPDGPSSSSSSSDSDDADGDESEEGEEEEEEEKSVEKQITVSTRHNKTSTALTVTTVKLVDDPARPRYRWDKEPGIKDLMKMADKKSINIPMPHTMGYLTAAQQKVFDYSETRQSKPLKGHSTIKPYVPSSEETAVRYMEVANSMIGPLAAHHPIFPWAAVARLLAPNLGSNTPILMKHFNTLLNKMSTLSLVTAHMCMELVAVIIKCFISHHQPSPGERLAQQHQLKAYRFVRGYNEWKPWLHNWEGAWAQVYGDDSEEDAKTQALIESQPDYTQQEFRRAHVTKSRQPTFKETAAWFDLAHNTYIPDETRRNMNQADLMRLNAHGLECAAQNQSSLATDKRRHYNISSANPPAASLLSNANTHNDPLTEDMKRQKAALSMQLETSKASTRRGKESADVENKTTAPSVYFPPTSADKTTQPAAANTKQSPANNPNRNRKAPPPSKPRSRNRNRPNAQQVTATSEAADSDNDSEELNNDATQTKREDQTPKQVYVNMAKGTPGTITINDPSNDREVTCCEECGYVNHAWPSCARNDSSELYDEGMARRYMGTWRPNTLATRLDIKHPQLHGQGTVARGVNRISSANSTPLAHKVNPERAKKNGIPQNQDKKTTLPVRMLTVTADQGNGGDEPMEEQQNIVVNHVNSDTQSADSQSSPPAVAQFHRLSRDLITMRVHVYVCGQKCHSSVIDTGAHRTIMSHTNWLKFKDLAALQGTHLQLNTKNKYNIQPATGPAVQAVGTSVIPITLRVTEDPRLQYTQPIDCLIVNGLTDTSGVILGMDTITTFFDKLDIVQKCGHFHRHLTPDSGINLTDEGVGTIKVSATHVLPPGRLESVLVTIEGPNLTHGIDPQTTPVTTVAGFSESTYNRKGRMLNVHFHNFIADISTNPSTRIPISINLFNRSNLPLTLTRGRIIGSARVQSAIEFSLSRITSPQFQMSTLLGTLTQEQISDEFASLAPIIQRLDVEEVAHLIDQAIVQQRHIHDHGDIHLPFGSNASPYEEQQSVNRQAEAAEGKEQQ